MTSFNFTGSRKGCLSIYRIPVGSDRDLEPVLVSGVTTQPFSKPL